VVRLVVVFEETMTDRKCSNVKVLTLLLLIGALSTGVLVDASVVQEQEGGGLTKGQAIAGVCPLVKAGKHVAELFPMSIHQTVELRRPSSVTISPDAREIAYVVTQAQLASNSYTSALCVVTAIGGTPKLLDQAEHITAVQWMLDGTHLTYLARKSGAYQAWTVRQDGAELRKLTHHATGVGAGNPTNLDETAFRMSPSGRQALFFTRDSAAALRQSVARYDGPVLYTDDMYAEQFGSPRYVWTKEPAAAAELWLVDFNTGSERRVWVAPRPATGSLAVEFAWSPDGKSVAILYQYDGDPRVFRRRLVLLSTMTWVAREVLPMLGWTRSARWSADSRSITFKSEGEVTDKTPRTGREDLYQYQLDDGHLIRITDDESITIWKSGQRTTTGREMYTCSVDRGHTRAACIREDANTPPDVIVYEVNARGELIEPGHIVTTVNPELAGVSLGEAQLLPPRLKDVDTGGSGIILPAGYQLGKRYPLVVMLYNQYSPTRFTGTTATYAPQTFAGHGYVVLLENLPADASNYPRGDYVAARAHEVDDVVQSLRVILDTLIAQGIVDSKRMGIIGWSWGCFYTSYILTHHPDWFKAGAVIDGENHNPSAYWRDTAAFREQEDGFFGSGPYGRYADRWRAVSPILNAAKMRAPLLMEYQLLYLMGIEFQRALLEQGKQAELVIYPNEEHALVRPSNRYASMMRHFDWFNFWLLGEEDPDSAKAEQYARWRQLREANQKSNEGSDSNTK
jgi:dipeptidyl aminopeptidase/acylaminoacyl peptidase